MNINDLTLVVDLIKDLGAAGLTGFIWYLAVTAGTTLIKAVAWLVALVILIRGIARVVDPARQATLCVKRLSQLVLDKPHYGEVLASEVEEIIHEVSRLRGRKG